MLTNIFPQNLNLKRLILTYCIQMVKLHNTPKWYITGNLLSTPSSEYPKERKTITEKLFI